MSRKKYSFIDLCVMPELRDHIVAEHGAVLFSENLEQVIWANSEGAKLLNISPTGDTLDNLPAWFRSTIRQIHGAVEQLQDEPEVTAMMRLRAGFN